MKMYKEEVIDWIAAERMKYEQSQREFWILDAVLEIMSTKKIETEKEYFQYKSGKKKGFTKEIRCKLCGRRVYGSDNYCPGCGRKFIN